MIRQTSTPTLVEVDKRFSGIEQDIEMLSKLIKANSARISRHGTRFILIEEAIGSPKRSSHLGRNGLDSEESKGGMQLTLEQDASLSGNVTKHQEGDGNLEFNNRRRTYVEAKQEEAPERSSNIIICNDAEFEDEINNEKRNSSRHHTKLSLPEALGNFETSDDSPEHYFLPPDTYSFFACTEYCNSRCIPNKIFLIAAFVLAVQLCTLWVFSSDYIDISNQKNPIEVPGGTKIGITIAQLIALLISSFSQDEIRASLNVLQIGYHQHKVQVISSVATKSKWYLSAIIRLLLGIFNLAITFILVVNSSTVRDVMLNFAAVTFVSELDNGTYELAKWGYLGKEAKHKALMIESTPLYDSDSKRKRTWQIPRFVSFVLITTIYFGFWTFVIMRQMNGHYLDENIFVQFGDEFSPQIGAFSGLYGIEKVNKKLYYVPVDSNSSTKFFYCTKDESWVFRYGDETEGYYKTYDEKNANCWSRARSADTLSFDIIKASKYAKWYTYDEESSLNMPLQHFVVERKNEYYGKICDGNETCGSRLYCKQGNCACNDGRFGLNCEFSKPCTTLEIDELDPEGFAGTREWSRIFSIAEEEGNTFQAYNKPIYIGEHELSEGMYDVILFIGRRWILTDSDQFDDYRTIASNNTGKIEFAKYLNHHFHGYWSNYSFFFVSEAVDIKTPNDEATPVGLRWFRLENDVEDSTRGFDFNSKDVKKRWKEKTSIKANLFCTVCNDQTNPCLHGANCMSDGTCNCSTGSKGKMCQISPDGNGFCDVYFNTPIFNYDGGDCCGETCKNTEEYMCGDGVISSDGGVFAYGRIGFPNCTNPSYSSKLSGSKTLYDIVERGKIKCGSNIRSGFLRLKGSVYVGFGAALCQAIAAAVLDDPKAVEIVEVDTVKDRFTGLANENFDVLVSTSTYTAERDIYQGFTFATSPFYYDGLVYGGIPTFVDCVNKLDNESMFCKDLLICVVESTTWFDTTKNLFSSENIVLVKDVEAEFNGLKADLCNVIAGERYVISERMARKAGFEGEYKLGTNLHSKEPLALVTREDDIIWSRFVSWVFEALLQAEESSITKNTAHKLATTNVFGEQFKNMFKNAVAANGNYGEIYLQYFEKVAERNGLNMINKGNTSLIYSMPFGKTNTQGPGPMLDGTIQRILKRGFLNCGVIKSIGFAVTDTDTLRWKGFDIDICRGISAALFNGSPDANIFPVSTSNRFKALASGDVDIRSAVTTHTLQREVKEPATGLPFDFSPAYFYDGLGFGGSFPHVICADEFNFESTNLHQHCADTRICVPDGTTWIDVLRGPRNVPEANLVVTLSFDDSYNKLGTGACNVVAGETGDLTFLTREYEYAGKEFFVSWKKHTKEPLAVVTLSDDTQFSDFVRWIVSGYFFAAEKDIKRSNYYDMPTSNLFGNRLAGMWQNAIQAVGSYDEIMTRNFGNQSSYEGPNSVNSKNGPQHFAIPGINILN